MDTFKKFKDDILKKIENFISGGKISEVNEVAANIMVGIMMMVIIILTIICLGLNEFGVFTANKNLMRWCTFLSLGVQIPASALNSIYRGDKKWLKYILGTALILQCAFMGACLGHNVVLLMVLPVIISTRYFDKKFTKQTLWLTLAAYFLASGFSVFFGVVNLNVFRVPENTIITVNDSLRQAIEFANPERKGYYTSYILNDFVPRLLIFLVIGAACVKVAQRGKELIDLQSDYTKKSSRIETELDLATKIQTGMLPCIFPAFPEFGNLQLYAKNVPAKEVGGDFYDYFEIDEDHVALVMADVSGKGVGAALFMTISKIVIKNLLQSGIGPAEAMTKANEQLCENNEAGLFVTTWIGVYNTKTGELVFSNAGHNPPIIIKKDGQCYYLKKRCGLVLAGMDKTKYKEESITLEIGDEIFLYTDGVTEATNTHQHLYGEDRLLNLINNINKDTAEQQINEIFADVNKFVDGAEQFDDITMMVMKIIDNK